MFGYLSEFWDAVAEVVVGGTTYTVNWFKSIGNAVAGAIGSLFDGIIHLTLDSFDFILYFIGWIGYIIICALSPIIYIANFIWTFIKTSFGTPIYNTELQGIASSVTAAINIIPFADYLKTGLVLVLMLIVVINIVNEIQDMI